MAATDLCYQRRIGPGCEEVGLCCRRLAPEGGIAEGKTAKAGNHRAVGAGVQGHVDRALDQRRVAGFACRVEHDGKTAARRAHAGVEFAQQDLVEQGRVQRERFLTPGSGYQPGNARMFGNGNN